MQLAPTHYQSNRTRGGVMTVKRDPTRSHVEHSQSVKMRVGVMMVRRDSAKPSMESLTVY